MSYNLTPDSYINLFNTPEGRAHNEIIYAQYSAVLQNPQALPSDISSAAERFRQERFVKSGLEGLTGSSSCYHLQEITDKLLTSASVLYAHELMMDCLIERKRPRELLRRIARAHGYRYLVGVRGLSDALKEAGVSEVQRDRFMLERADFHRRFLPLADAAFMVNQRGDNPSAATHCLRMLVDELAFLADWMDLTAQGSRSVLMRAELCNVNRMIQEYEVQTVNGTGQNKRGKTKRRMF